MSNIDYNNAYSEPLLVDAGITQGSNNAHEEISQEELNQYSTHHLRVTNTFKFLGCSFQGWMLISICFLTFGSYWVFDTPGAIENSLEDWFNGENQTGFYDDAKNEILYSVYSWPNTVLAFFGGFIVDKVTGVRLGALIFGGLITLGHVLFCVGVQFKLYWLCVVGRFVFGLGGESLTVAQNTYTVRWFDGAQLALVFGLVVAFARIGSSVNFAVSPILASSVTFAVWFGALMCLVSFFFTLVAMYLDWWGSKKTDEKRLDIIKQLPPRVQAQLDIEDDLAANANDEVHITHIRYFGASAWLLMTICLFFYVGVLVFYQVASKIMQKTGNKYDENTASLYVSIPNFVSIVASPLFGRLVDRKGRALYFIAIASLALIVAHFLFICLAEEWFVITPIPIMIWLGLSYSLGAAALWPILAFIIDKKMLGTAYGCMTAVQNLGLAIFPLVIGAMQDADGISGTTYQWTVPIITFSATSFISFFLTIILVVLDKKNGGRLNASAAERAQMIKNEEDLKLSFTQNEKQALINGQVQDGSPLKQLNRD